MKNKNINYSNNTVPKKYFCSKCKANNCKLWREYNAFYSQLLCANCAVKNQKKNFIIDEDGNHNNDGFKSDQIGWFVPAIPDEEGIGYWGYTSVPLEGINWWRQLPTYPIK